MEQIDLSKLTESFSSPRVKQPVIEQFTAIKGEIVEALIMPRIVTRQRNVTKRHRIGHRYNPNELYGYSI